MQLEAFDWLLDDVIIEICSFYENKTVCAGAIEEMTPIVMKTLFEGFVSSGYLCSHLGMCADPKYTLLNYQDYVDNVLKTKPAELDSNDYINKMYANISPDDETVKILHLTDPHIDFNYTVGSNAKCGNPLCCRPENGPAPTPEDAAGQWGDYNCDPPVWLLDSAFRYIKNEIPDLAGLLWTGDNIQHNIWAQTTADSVWNTQQLSEMIKAHFPNLPIFPVLGNHEPIPVNVYDTENSHNAMNEGIAEAWEDWLDEAALEQFKKTGYYEIEMPMFENVRFIGLNSNVCNNQNFYFFRFHGDPANHLQWLKERLEAARKDGKKVWLGSHFSSGMDCFSEWGIRFRAIMDAFQDVVLAHLIGHTHSELFEILRDAKSQTSPLHGVLGSGSITTYTNKNPNLQVFVVHKKTGLVLNSIAYSVNLAEANAAPDQDPAWGRKYDYLSEYGMKDLSPGSLDDLANRMKEDEELALKYKANALLDYGKPTGSCD